MRHPTVCRNTGTEKQTTRLHSRRVANSLRGVAYASARSRHSHRNTASQACSISHPRPATARLRRSHDAPPGRRLCKRACLTSLTMHFPQTCGLSHPRPATAGLGRARATPHRGVAYASAPIGSHAGREMAGSSRAAWYSAGSRAFGTATSYTYSVNQSSLIVK